MVVISADMEASMVGCVVGFIEGVIFVGTVGVDVVHLGKVSVRKLPRAIPRMNKKKPKRIEDWLRGGGT